MLESINQSISLFASKYTYWNIIYVNGRSPKTPSSTSWRPIINGTKANVVLEKHTIKQKKNIQAKTKQEAKSAKKLKWRTAAMRDSRNNINDTDNTRNYHV